LSDTFVVIWRHSPKGAWQVQPFIHSSVSADAIGARLLAQYRGQCLIVPVDIPPYEDASDLEEG